MQKKNLLLVLAVLIEMVGIVLIAAGTRRSVGIIFLSLGLALLVISVAKKKTA